MDASQITKLLQKQNTRYINRCQTVDSSTLTWKNQIQSSKYIKGVKTCDGSQNWNVPTNPCCANQVVVEGIAQNTGTYSFGGSGRTTALQTGSPQHFLNVLSGASGSASQVYSSESITLQRAGKESCGVAGTNPAPANSYVVLPGGDPATSNSQLQVPSCSYICSNTNGPTPSNETIGQPGSNSINNSLNPYLPPFDTYYKFKNPSAQCQYPVQDQNQKHFVKKCNQCPDGPQIAGFINTNPYTIEPPAPPTPPILSISYQGLEPTGGFTCLTFDETTYQVVLGPSTPPGGTFSINFIASTPPIPPLNPVTVNPVTGLLTIPGSGTNPSQALWVVTYTINDFETEWSQVIGPC
jgi:hypothetical protein